MDPSTDRHIERAAQRRRVLVVADWAVDPEAVVSACASRMEQGPQSFALVVPAWLHGLDWVGDPKASTLCARRQVDGIDMLAGRRGLDFATANVGGLDFATANVGDPDVLTAISDALADWPADELLLCTRARPLHLTHPFDLAPRARRLTGMPVQQVGLPWTEAAGRPRVSMRRRNGHCMPEQPQIA